MIEELVTSENFFKASIYFHCAGDVIYFAGIIGGTACAMLRLRRETRGLEGDSLVSKVKEHRKNYYSMQRDCFMKGWVPMNVIALSSMGAAYLQYFLK